jgi:AraC family transcriptional regulator of adaptative response/methylated-DNA-[protein]-cysteine methyltransferase
MKRSRSDIRTRKVAAAGDCLRIARVETPLGPMLAAVTSNGVCHLEFADRHGLREIQGRLRRRWTVPIVEGENAVTGRLRRELDEYFRGKRRVFTVPVAMRGTAFQERVWRELERISYGQTASYDAVACRIGSPTAARAVARADATNPVCLLVPCHRVIRKDGSLSGYGGGVWRKRRLIELEQAEAASPA